MPRKKNPVPKYSHHKPTGQAFIGVPDNAGGYSYIYLGKHGSEESREEYERAIGLQRLGQAAAMGKRFTSTVNEVLVAFLRHAKDHYRRPDGTQTREFSEYIQISRIVRRLYGSTLAKDFGPLALQAVRQAFRS